VIVGREGGTMGWREGRRVGGRDAHIGHHIARSSRRIKKARRFVSGKGSKKGWGVEVAPAGKEGRCGWCGLYVTPRERKG